MSAADLFAPGLLAGSTALVTGGGTGIGRATALTLAALGAQVAVTGRRPEPLAETVDLATPLDGLVWAYPADLREPDQCTALLDAVHERLGGVGVLVNNAGGQFVAPAETITDGGFHAVHRINLDAAWRLTRECATRWMIPRRSGTVVSIVMVPRRGMPYMSHSSAARAAVESLTRTLAVEWGRYGIRLAAVAPGLVDTAAWRRYGLDPAQAAAMIPLQRLATPDDVAAAVAFLASPAGAYVTGQTLVVDGGLDVAPPGLPPLPG